MIHWTEEYLGGHISFHLFGTRFTFFGFNAMHVALNISTKRWGYICFHPHIKCFGQLWPWYFYLSPDATPQSATYIIGPGASGLEKISARVRKYLYGHNFSDPDDTRYSRMSAIRDKVEYAHWKEQVENEAK